MGFLDCPVCMEQYDKEERCPRCLSCGHTLCTTCLTGIIGRGSLDCPFCRNTHISPVSSANDVPVNYTVVSIMEEASLFPSKQKSSPLLTQAKKEVNCIITSKIMNFNSNLTRLEDLKQCLSMQQSSFDLHMHALKSLIEKTEGFLQEVVNTADQVAVAVKEGVKKRSFMEAQQAKVETATSVDEVNAVRQNDCSSDVREWGAVAHQLLQFPVLTVAREMKLAMTSTLQALADANMTDITMPAASTNQVFSYTVQDQDHLPLTPSDQDACNHHHSHKSNTLRSNSDDLSSGKPPCYTFRDSCLLHLQQRLHSPTRDFGSSFSSNSSSLSKP